MRSSTPSMSSREGAATASASSLSPAAKLGITDARREGRRSGVSDVLRSGALDDRLSDRPEGRLATGDEARRSGMPGSWAEDLRLNEDKRLLLKAGCSSSS